MATDARGHTIPASTDSPSAYIAQVTALSGSMNDLVTVANTTARAAAATAIAPTTSRPLVVYRADATVGREIEVTEDGSTWKVLPFEDDTAWVSSTPAQYTGSVSYKRRNGWGSVQYELSSIDASATSVSPTYLNLPTGFRPDRNVFGTITRRLAATGAPTTYLVMATSAGAVQILQMSIAAGDNLTGSVNFPLA